MVEELSPRAVGSHSGRQGRRVKRPNGEINHHWEEIRNLTGELYQVSIIQCYMDWVGV